MINVAELAPNLPRPETDGSASQIDPKAKELVSEENTSSASSSSRQLMVGWRQEADTERSIGFEAQISRPRREAAPVPIHLPEQGHLMTFARTGAGKGVGAIIPALLTYEGSVVVIDPKGENYAVTARRRREMGQQVYLLDPFRCVSQAGGDSLNPFDMIDAEDTETGEGYDSIASLISSQTSHHDAFWDETALTVITGLLALVHKVRPPVLRNLQEVMFLLNQPLEELSYTRQELKKINDDHCRAAAAILETEQKCLLSILATARIQVKFLKGPRVGAATSRSTIDINRIANSEPTSLFLVLPPERLASHGKLLRLWIGLLMNTIIRQRRASTLPTLFILDEAAQLGSFEQFRTAMTLLRGYGLLAWSFWQDPTQLSRLYPKDWQTLVNNCAAVQCFGAANYNSAKDIAELTGFGPAERILALRGRQQVLCLPGLPPQIVGRPDYRTDTPFAGLFDENPFYRGMRSVKQIGTALLNPER